MIQKDHRDRQDWFSERFLYGQAPETLNRVSGSSESKQQKEINEATQERMGFKDALDAYNEYKNLKSDTVMQETVRQAEMAHASGETLSPEEEEKVIEYNRKIIRQLQIMEAALCNKAAETLPDGFNREQMLDEVFKIADEWGLREAGGDLARYFASQDAMQIIFREKLGDDFNDLPPAEMARRLASISGIENVPPEMNRYLRTMGMDMPPGFTFGPIQGLLERIAGNSSLSKGSFLAKAGGNLAQTIVTTGLLANVIGPLFGFGFSLMKNITNPREAVKQMRQQMAEIKPSQLIKVGTGLAVFGGLGAIAITDKPLDTVADISHTIRGFGGDAFGAVSEAAGSFWERATGNTPSHRMVNALKLKAGAENQNFFEADEGRNSDLLREFYSRSDANFDLGELDKIRNREHLNELMRHTVNAENLPADIKTLYETGRRRLEAAKNFFASTNELARRFQMSPADIANIQVGGLAKLLNNRYEATQPQEKGFLTKFTEKAANVYETEFAEGVSGFGRGLFRSATNVVDIFENIILGNQEYSPIADRYRNIQQIPGREEAPPPAPGLVPTAADLEEVGFKVNDNWRNVLPYANEASQIFAGLLAHAHQIQHPRSFRGAMV